MLNLQAFVQCTLAAQEGPSTPKFVTVHFGTVQSYECCTYCEDESFFEPIRTCVANTDSHSRLQIWMLPCMLGDTSSRFMDLSHLYVCRLLVSDLLKAYRPRPSLSSCN